MGYSVSLRATSKKLQQKMLDFWAKEYRPHWKIRGLPERACYTSDPTDDPSYSSGAYVIGIDFNASGFERGYAFTLVRWMALQIGKSRLSFSEPKWTFPKPVPYMLYDEDAWPVLDRPLSSVDKKLRWCCVDSFGMKLDVGLVDDYVFDLSDDMVAFNEAQHEAEEKYGVDPDQRLAGLRDPEIGWKIRAMRNKILMPKVKKLLIPMRDEMKRLDAAWKAG